MHDARCTGSKASAQARDRLSALCPWPEDARRLVRGTSPEVDPRTHARTHAWRAGRSIRRVAGVRSEVTRGPMRDVRPPCAAGGVRCTPGECALAGLGEAIRKCCRCRGWRSALAGSGQTVPAMLGRPRGDEDV